MSVVQNSPAITVGLALLLALSASSVDAQSGGAFEITRSTVDAGGYDKGSDLSPIADLAPKLGGLYTIGVTDPAIASGGGFMLRGGFHAAAAPPPTDAVFKDSFESP